jgi:hypothetical protein
VCAKKNSLAPKEVERISNDYFQALRLARGEQVANMTDLYFRKGWFHLRPPGLSREALAHTYRPQEIETMTTELRKQILPRPDSDDDGDLD